MEDSGSRDLEALLARVTLSLKLPGGETYPRGATPDHTSAEIDPEDGTIAVRATLANPDFILRPGMIVTVTSRIAPMETAQ
jgi:multidrug efflux pump subunit AcrA (membrane-fusion protein)